MQERKFVQLLKELTLEEEKAFYKDVKNAKKQLQIVYGFCRKYYPDFSDPKFNEEECVKRTKIPAKRINNLLAELGKFLEDFLIRQELASTESDLVRRFLLLNAFKKKNMDKYFFEVAKEVQEVLEKQTEKDLEFHYNQYYLNKLLYRHPRHKEHWAVEILEPLIRHLDTFCIGSVLKYQCLLGNISDISPTDSQLMLTKFMGDIEGEEAFFAHDDLVQIYLKLLNSLNADSADYHEIEKEELEMEALKTFIFKNIYLLMQEEQVNVLTWLVNSSLKRYFFFADAEIRFLRMVLTVYRTGLDKRIWLVNNQIATDHFNTIFVVSMMLKEHEWAQQFVEKYIDHLPDTKRENTRSFCLARIAFAEKKYLEAVALLGPFENLNFYDFIYERVLLLKCYYELQEEDGDYFDELDRLIASFERYLDRGVQTQKITTTFAAPFKGFVKFVRLIFNEKQSKTTLVALLRDAQNVTDRNWLMEKIG